ncbi:putative protein [Arabidopsis thaliana]|uniref:Uncharacterized protein n=1 Tax=Arabidopsis thaliana TaxID=3702 RepID=Q9M2A3_ARATH|nr:putative protein [Arabidopsis thaliana]
MDVSTPPPAEIYLAIQLPNPLSILFNYLPVSLTPINTLRGHVNTLEPTAINMDEFMTWLDFVLPKTPFQPYFTLLLERGASPALYLEGVRLACNFVTVAHGITMLGSISATDAYACFLHGLFLTATGNGREFEPVNATFWDLVPSFEDANTTAWVIAATELAATIICSTGMLGSCAYFIKEWRSFSIFFPILCIGIGYMLWL